MAPLAAAASSRRDVIVVAVLSLLGLATWGWLAARPAPFPIAGHVLPSGYAARKAAQQRKPKPSAGGSDGTPPAMISRATANPTPTARGTEAGPTWGLATDGGTSRRGTPSPTAAAGGSSTGNRTVDIGGSAGASYGSMDVGGLDTWEVPRRKKKEQHIGRLQQMFDKIAAMWPAGSRCNPLTPRPREPVDVVRSRPGVVVLECPGQVCCCARLGQHAEAAIHPVAGSHPLPVLHPFGRAQWGNKLGSYAVARMVAEALGWGLEVCESLRHDLAFRGNVLPDVRGIAYDRSLLEQLPMERHDGFYYPVADMIADTTPRVITLAGLPFRD